MFFSDLFFLYLFLPLCAVFYFLAKTKYRNAVLIIFSLIFYAWGEPVFLWLLLFSTCLNYMFGRMICSGRSKSGMILGLLVNLGILIGAGYSGAIAEGIRAVTGADFPVPDIPFPLGLSFYTLRAISYIADCYQGRVQAEMKFNRFLLYMTLFPIVMQGPVVRYETMQNQLGLRTSTMEDFSNGLGRIVMGLGKKVLLADQLAMAALPFLEGSAVESQTALGMWYGVILFALRIYFDLSGYSDIAIGIGRLFGFHFEENFRSPFLCTSITDFWTRWHMTLSGFFRDYVQHISVFGKIGGLILMWLCMGLWHGMGWNFVIWGLYFALFMGIEMLIGEERMRKIPVFLRHLYSKLVVILSFVFLCFTDLDQLLTALKTMFFAGENGVTSELLTASVQSSLFLILAAVFCCFPVLTVIKKKMQGSSQMYLTMQTVGTILSAVLLVISSIFLTGENNLPFFYMQR